LIWLQKDGSQFLGKGSRALELSIRGGPLGTNIKGTRYNLDGEHSGGDQDRKRFKVTKMGIKKNRKRAVGGKGPSLGSARNPFLTCPPYGVESNLNHLRSEKQSRLIRTLTKESKKSGLDSNFE